MKGRQTRTGGRRIFWSVRYDPNCWSTNIVNVGIHGLGVLGSLECPHLYPSFLRGFHKVSGVSKCCRKLVNVTLMIPIIKCLTRINFYDVVFIYLNNTVEGVGDFKGVRVLRG